MAGGIGKKEAERIVADSPVEGGMHNDLEMVERLARLTAIDATDSRWDTQTKRTVLVILLVAAVFGVWLSRSVLGFLTMAGIVAYLLNPVVDLAQRLRIRRSVTTISLFVLVFVLIILLPVLLVPILIQQLTELSRFDVSGIAFSLFIWFSKLLGNLPDRVEMLGFAIPTNPIVQQIEEGFRQIRFIPTVTEILNYVQQVLGTATTVVSTTALFGINFVGGIFQVFFGLLVVFFLSLYLTKDLPDIRNYVESLLPPSYQSEFREVLRRMGMIWQAFFRGQIILCTAIGISTHPRAGCVGAGDGRRSFGDHSKFGANSGDSTGCVGGIDPGKRHAGGLWHQQRWLCLDHSRALFCNPTGGKQHSGAPYYREQCQPAPDHRHLRGCDWAECGWHSGCISGSAFGCFLACARQLYPRKIARLPTLYRSGVTQGAQTTLSAHSFGRRAL